MYKILGIAAILIAYSLFASNVKARTFELVKSEHSDTVYYVDDDTIRHPFPNIDTYKSWYGDDFSDVIVVNDTILSTMPLGKNITIRSGTALVKVPSWPDVYAVEPGGLLRYITDAGIAVNLYGNEWEKMIKDIPEVFFGDYTIGEDIHNSFDIPDGILYKRLGEDVLYFKDRDILQRFSSREVVIKNGLPPDDPFINSQAYYTRSRIIEERQDDIFNPAVEPFVSNTDCAVEKMNIGFLYLHKGELRETDVSFIQNFKTKFPAFWNFVTWELSEVDVSFPLNIISDSDIFSKRDEDSGEFLINNELIYEFYNTSPDIFDAIYIFTNFSVGSGTGATYSSVTNSVNGVGKNRLDRSALFGSRGKLKGVITMGDINLYSHDTKRLEDSGLERMSHELLHQWSGSLKFIDKGGALNSSLLTDDGAHWSQWNTFVSPLGGLGWSSGGGDIYVKDASIKAGFERRLPEIDLYTMGLLPAQVIKDIVLLKTEAVESTTDTIEGVEKHIIHINQIIQAEGKRNCWN